MLECFILYVTYCVCKEKRCTHIPHENRTKESIAMYDDDDNTTCSYNFSLFFLR